VPAVTVERVDIVVCVVVIAVNVVDRVVKDLIVEVVDCVVAIVSHPTSPIFAP
jgi:hypothetical protein